MNKLKKITLFSLLCFIILAFGSCEEKNKWEIFSPNKHIKIIIKKDENKNKELSYTVLAKTDSSYIPIVQESPLGIELDCTQFTNKLSFNKAEIKQNIAIDYTMLSGSQQKYSNTYNQISLSFKNDKNLDMNLVFRALNNGAAFQYQFPGDASQSITITKEHSGFKLGEGEFFGHPYDSIRKWGPSYETYYSKALPIGTNSPNGKNGWAFPLLLNTNKHWVYISESGFDGSYGASHIEENCENGLYRMKFAEVTEAQGYYETHSVATLPTTTPWRLMTIGNSLDDIAESHLVSDLAYPQKLENTDWIESGRASWSWWSESDSPVDYDRLIPFIDLAAQMGWEYSLIDANWNFMKNGNVEKLTQYAAEKNVGLLLWYNSGGKHNVITEAPRDLMDNSDARRKEFKRISELGIKGIKVDFFQSDKQAIIKQYIGILEDAAEFKLLVNFHGCNLPRGWRRTYPNLLSTEAIKGAEAYKFHSEYPENAPAHITTIPFLRGLAGPTDYTPGGFRMSTYPHLTTAGFELALPILIESGITHYVIDPETLNALPDFAQTLLKEIPARWDSIKYIYGYPGKDAIIARKSKNRWFIAGINGENTEKIISLDLEKITSEKNLSIQIYKDSSDGTELNFETVEIDEGQIPVKLLPYGGFVAVLAGE